MSKDLAFPHEKHDTSQKLAQEDAYFGPIAYSPDEAESCKRLSCTKIHLCRTLKTSGVTRNIVRFHRRFYMDTFAEVYGELERRQDGTLLINNIILDGEYLRLNALHLLVTDQVSTFCGSHRVFESAFKVKDVDWESFMDMPATIRRPTRNAATEFMLNSIANASTTFIDDKFAARTAETTSKPLREKGQFLHGLWSRNSAHLRKWYRDRKLGAAETESSRKMQVAGDEGINTDFRGHLSLSSITVYACRAKERYAGSPSKSEKARRRREARDEQKREKAARKAQERTPHSVASEHQEGGDYDSDDDDSDVELTCCSCIPFLR